MLRTPEQSIEFLTLTTEIYRDESRIQLEREKLAFRMQRWTQRRDMNQARGEKHAEEGQVKAEK